jgi:RHS repeat-associated protein
MNYVTGGVTQVPTITAGATKQAMVGNLPTTVPKNGYLYIYVSNESPQDVYFDDLTIQHHRGPLLEENHYYPFGLTMAGISDKALKPQYTANKFKYNGKELQNQEFSDGSGLELYDYASRLQDPQIGRFGSIDAHAENYRSLSPFSYVSNNPVSGTDPTGMDFHLEGADAQTYFEYWVDQVNLGLYGDPKSLGSGSNSNSAQGSEEHDGNDDMGLPLPLSKAKLLEATQKLYPDLNWGQLNRMAGYVLERAYFEWRKTHSEPGENPLVPGVWFPTTGVPNRDGVVTDGMSDVIVHYGDAETGEYTGMDIYPKVHWTEVKSSPGNLTASGPDGDYQLEGLFNALHNWAVKIGLPAKFHPNINFVTTWDVGLGLSIDRLSSKYSVTYTQQIAFYEEHNGNVYVAFGSTNSWTNIIPPFNGYVPLK